jgi:hypothetical protein
MAASWITKTLLDINSGPVDEIMEIAPDPQLPRFKLVAAPVFDLTHVAGVRPRMVDRLNPDGRVALTDPVSFHDRPTLPGFRE